MESSLTHNAHLSTYHDAENCDCCLDFWQGAHPLKDDSDNDSGYGSVTQKTDRECGTTAVIPVIHITPLTDTEQRIHNTCVRILHSLRIANLVPYNTLSATLDPSPYSANSATAKDAQKVARKEHRERNFPQQTLYVPQEAHTKRLKDTWENRSIWPSLFQDPYTTTPYLSPSASNALYGASKRASASSTSLDRYGRRKSLGVEVHPAMMTTSVKRPRGWSIDAHRRPTTTTTTANREEVKKRRMSVDSVVSTCSTIEVDRASFSGSSRASSPVSSSSRSSLSDDSSLSALTTNVAPVRTAPLGNTAKQNRTISVDAQGIPTWRSTSPYIYATPKTSSRLDSNSSLSSVSTSNHHYQDENNQNGVGTGRRRLVRGNAVKRPYSTGSTSSLPAMPSTGSTTSLESSKTTTNGAGLMTRGANKPLKSLSTDHLVSLTASDTSLGSNGGAEKVAGRRSGFGRLKNFVGGLYSTAPSSFRL